MLATKNDAGTTNTARMPGGGPHQRRLPAPPRRVNDMAANLGVHGRAVPHEAGEDAAQLTRSAHLIAAPKEVRVVFLWRERARTSARCPVCASMLLSNLERRGKRQNKKRHAHPETEEKACNICKL